MPYHFAAAAAIHPGLMRIEQFMCLYSEKATQRINTVAAAVAIASVPPPNTVSIVY